MKIEIQTITLDKEFCLWLRDTIKNQIKTSINDKKLIVWNKYLNSDGVLTFTNKKSITAKDIIYNGADALRVRQLPQKYIIEIDPNKKMFGVLNKKVDTLCRLINYGNSEIKGYPIFSDTMENVANNINAYIDLYMIERSRGNS